MASNLTWRLVVGMALGLAERPRSRQDMARSAHGAIDILKALIAD